VKSPLRKIAATLIPTLRHEIFITGGSGMKFIVTMFQDEDGAFIAECPSMPGCVSQGRTEEEAERNIEQAIRECLEVRAERGMPLSVSTREVEVPV
jgi:predicted RNase H-like HicB family nuclease